MRRTVRLRGIEAEVVSDAEAEECTAVVCMEAGTGPYPWNDNVETNCSACGRAIIHRPHVPKKPPKICLACANTLLGQEAKH